MICTSFLCEQNTHTRFAAGAAAGATAVTATYPFDLLRARMAAHWNTSPRYTSCVLKSFLPALLPATVLARVAFSASQLTAHHVHTIHTLSLSPAPARYGAAVRRMVSSEGGWANMYKGLRPTLLGVVPYAGLSFMTFETLKSYVVRAHDADRGSGATAMTDAELPTMWRLGCGGLAGLLSQSATYPLDIVRRRMQVASASSQHTHDYKGVIDALRKIAQSEGVARGLYKGLSMNWLKGPVAVAVSFTVNDTLKGKIRRWHNSDSVMFGS